MYCIPPHSLPLTNNSVQVYSVLGLLMVGTFNLEKDRLHRKDLLLNMKKHSWDSLEVISRCNKLLYSKHDSAYIQYFTKSKN